MRKSNMGRESPLLMECGMAAIQLTRGKYTLIDAADVEDVDRWNWSALRDGHTWYAMRSYGVSLHRHLMGLSPGDGLEVDHIDGDGLNNIRKNLRVCTHAENARNCRLRSGTTSKFRGVYWYRPTYRGRERWKAQISTSSKMTHLGFFNDETDAARAYNAAAIKYHGDFARLNDV